MEPTRESRCAWGMSKALSVLINMLVCGLVGSVADAGPIYVESFGSYGSANGQFNGPSGVAVDSDGNVYVADAGNHRIQKFSLLSGTPVHEWSFGGLGSGDGNFSSPRTVAVDSDGNVYVADEGNHRIQKFTQLAGEPYLSHEWSFGSIGDANGEFRFPDGVAVHSDGNVYVPDRGNHRIQKLNQSGGSGQPEWEWTYGIEGSGDGQFSHPWGVAVDNDGNVYVSDSGNHRIQKFTQLGGKPYLSHKWSSGPPIAGDANGQFSLPYGLAVAATGSVYVADSQNDRIVKLSQSDGNAFYEWSFGSTGDANAQLNYPNGVAVDSVGNVYVADYNNYRIQRWFDGNAIAPGQTATFPSLTVWSDASLGNCLTLGSGRTLEVVGTMTVQSGGTMTISGGTLNAGHLVIGSEGVLNIEGTVNVNGPVECATGGADQHYR